VRVTHSELAISAAHPAQFPEDRLPEVALAGRSNVGKSSLINRLTERRHLARTSSQPGKTRLLNFYRVNGALYLVDVPGYGYAKVSKAERQRWGRLIEQYLLERPTLRLVLLLVDLRHPPTADDRAMYDWLAYHRVPLCVVGTKADKLSRGRWDRHVRQARETLGLSKEVPFVLFSAETGVGRDELWARIGERVQISGNDLSAPKNDRRESEDIG
jgi:GTP-binding protein